MKSKIGNNRIRQSWALMAGLAMLSISVTAATIEKTYPVNNVTQLVISGDADVTIQQDGTEYLKIGTDAAEFSRVSVDQTDGKVLVKIAYKNNISNWFRRDSAAVHVTVRVKALEYLKLAGSSEAQIGNLDSTDKLTFHASGASEARFATITAGNLDVDLSGASEMKIEKLISPTQNYILSGSSELDLQSASEATDIKINASGASQVSFKRLKAKQAAVKASGASEVALGVSELLAVDASGASTVNYFGHPSVSQKTSGASEVEGHNAE